ncbi:hypothetical protein ACC724_38885, partial [Rhizobium ruizarguesonis]
PYLGIAGGDHPFGVRLQLCVGQVAQAAQVVFTLAHDGDRDDVFEVVESAFLRPIDGDGNVALLSNPSQKIAAKVREISTTIDSS